MNEKIEFLNNKIDSLNNKRLNKDNLYFVMYEYSERKYVVNEEGDSHYLVTYYIPCIASEVEMTKDKGVYIDLISGKTFSNDQILEIEKLNSKYDLQYNAVIDLFCALEDEYDLKVTYTKGTGSEGGIQPNYEHFHSDDIPYNVYNPKRKHIVVKEVEIKRGLFGRKR